MNVKIKEIGEPSALEFAYIYCIKALAKNEGFWYTSKREPNIEGVWGVRDNMGNYKDRFFFYPLEQICDFRITTE